jgi:signal transduction histidine kinase
VLDLIHIPNAEQIEEVFNLSDLLDNLVNEYQNTYESIRFDNTHTYPLYLKGLPKKIKLVFTNLLNNAVEAVSDGGCIEVIQEQYERKIRVIVRDNGTGLVNNFNLNNDFFTSKVNGTGMGLHYCKSTVAQHGGVFTIGNRPEGGCIAVVEFPV